MKEDDKILRKFIRKTLLLEYANIIEGVDIDKTNKVVSFNPSHEDNVDTSILLNPTHYEVDGFPVISIFKRKKAESVGLDGNPLVYALKGANGWKFKNPQTDIINLLKQFIRISEKIEPAYDTIITVPSKNELNQNFLHRLNKIIKSDFQITDYLFKLDADYVYENFIDWKQLSEDYPKDYSLLEKQLNSFFAKMIENNDNVFSFKYIQDSKLRKYITKTMDDYESKAIEYASFINDKNILILDDTIASGRTISEACKIIIESFIPKSITIITLFSKL